MTRRRPRRAVPARRPKRPPPRELSLIDTLRELMAEDLEMLRSGKGHDKKPLSQQQYRMLKSAVEKRVQTLGQLTGEGLEMSDAKIVKLPGFRRVVDDVVRALKPWPEAMAAVASALEQIERGESPAEEKTGT